MSVHTIEELSQTRRKFKVTIPAADVRKSWDKIFQEVQSTAEVRGFRKGKAPAALIRNAYSGDITKKVINNLINDSYSKVLKESKLQVLNQPNIEPEGEFSESADFTYSAVVDIYATVEIKDYKGLSLKLPEALNPEAEEKEVERVLKLETERLKEPPQELNDVLKKEVKSYFDSMRAQIAYKDIIDQLLEKNTFEVADVLVEQMIDQLIYNKEVVKDKKDIKSVPVRDKEFRNSFREDAAKQVKAVMALTHVAQQEKIEVPQDELFKSLSRFLEKNRLNFQQIRDNQNMILQEHKSEILLLKATQFIIDNAQITWEPSKKEDNTNNE